MSLVKEIDRNFKEEEYYGWRAAEKYAEEYITICKHAFENQAVFNNFRRYSSFVMIVEHVPVELAEKYLLNISKNNPELLEQMAEFSNANDLFGNPFLASWDSFGISHVSPTTIRYVKVLSDLTTLYGDLSGFNIVEIGAGYGGLCNIIHKKQKFARYYDVDLPEPLALSSLYCKRLGIDNFNVVQIDSLEKLEDVEIDLVISNYAFSECNYETQDIYIDKILSKAKRGYITHNTGLERQERTKNIIKNYNNFRIFDKDLCKKGHPIFVWGEK